MFAAFSTSRQLRWSLERHLNHNLLTSGGRTIQYFFGSVVSDCESYLLDTAVTQMGLSQDKLGFERCNGLMDI